MNKKNNGQIYIEQRPDGKYAATWGGGQRASAIEPTQAQAIDRAREIAPKAPIHVERVKHTNVGSPDQWRRP